MGSVGRGRSGRDGVVSAMTASRPRTDFVIVNGRPPASSYWAGATREQLLQTIAARRHQQAVPSERDVKYDPALAATADLMHRLALAKLRADARRRFVLRHRAR